MNVSRLIFFGTPDFAVASLDALVRGGHRPVLVVTQPDQPFGRGKKSKSPPVKEYCDQNGLTVIAPEKIKTQTFRSTLTAAKPDLMIVAAYGRILPQSLLDIALTINVHASLLPRWRGASPITHAILSGDPETGISIMKVVPELDAGPVLISKSLPIEPSDTTSSLTDRLGRLGGQTLLESIQMLSQGTTEFRPQDPKHATYAPMISSEDTKIHWSLPAKSVDCHIRAFNPPGAFTHDGMERIKIFKAIPTHQETDKPAGTLFREKKSLRVSCADQWMEILELQRPNKTRQGIVDFLNGYPKDRLLWQ